MRLPKLLVQPFQRRQLRPALAQRLRERRRESGVALILALWAVALFSMLALGITDSVHQQVDLVANAKGHRESEALADAAVHLSILALMQASDVRALAASSSSDTVKPEGPIALVDKATARWAWSPDAPLRVDATPYILEDLGGRVTIFFEAERGKLDLNAASSELLRRHLEILDVPPHEARGIAEAFERYRSERANQSERMRESSGAKAVFGVHRPFLSVDEFRNIDGVTRAIFASIEPHLTVFTGSAVPDAGVASRFVLAALENAPRSLMSGVAPVISLSEAFPAGESTLSAFPVAGGGSERFIYTIRADAITVSGYRFVREVVVELPQEDPASYLIHRWAQGKPRRH